MGEETTEVVEQGGEQGAGQEQGQGAGQEQGGGEQKPTSLHETIAKSMDAVFGPEGGEKAEEEEPKKPSTVVLGRDEQGRFRKVEGEQAPKQGEPKPKVQEPKQGEPKPKVQEPGDRAPQAWKALAREHWKELDKLPPETAKAIKAQLQEREREVNQRLSQDARARAEADGFRRTLAPFEQAIRANGHEPLAVVENLLRTSYQLAHGTPQQRAAIVASIVSGYGVDVGMLADAIDGQPPAGAPAGQVRDPRVDQLQAELRARDEQWRQRALEQDRREVETLRRGYEKFAEEHEFFEDVREDMARIVTWKAEEGVDISDEDAYKMAVNLHPEMAEVMRQREEVARAKSPQGRTQRALAAAGSVEPRTAALSGGEPDPKNLRAVIASAMDRHAGRA